VDANDDVRRLLEEIRDTQREHLAEYKRVTQRSLQLQEQAVARQEQMARLYRVVVSVLAVVLVAAGAFLFYLFRGLK